MSVRAAGRAALAAVLLAVAAPAGAASLIARAGDEVLLDLPAPEGAEWCLHWNHSVAGGAVADCFANEGGRMMLTRSFLHDFAAGLGTIPGRGTLVSAPGGYWIEDMDEAIAGNRLTLRVGRPSTDHRLRMAGHEHGLSDIAAGRRVTLTLAPE